MLEPANELGIESQDRGSVEVHAALVVHSNVLVELFLGRGQLGLYGVQLIEHIGVDHAIKNINRVFDELMKTGGFL